ncbi:DMT family transporter [Paenibacillus sp. LHD-117]|uniref:DMT family transporter n=1 Tax=Paenibacillus sp. LHD-117 TaxID=3071412 RepID=UPI0027DF7C47|nr:DMT family transporter [Paenibacillus sp. LHD-117]MDQ6421698.1 DMT family transporter [Paenibacillus sp. LHD-117]
MFMGIALALAAGSFISVQNMFNSKVNDFASSTSTTALVLGMGFLASLSMGLLFHGTAFWDFGYMPTWFWFSGLLGIGVVICVVNGVKELGPSYGISIVMASQLLCALWWDSAGWFGLEQVPFTNRKALGAVLLIGGLLLFKAKRKEKPNTAQEAA